MSTVERIPIPDRSAWLTLRRRDVTASDVAALVGAHPYRTKLAVWADKMGVGHDRGDNSAMRRGRIMEPAVAAAVGEENPSWRIEKAFDYLRDPDLRLGATPDYRVADGSRHLILECKTADPEIFARDWANGPPLAWMLQALTQAMLDGADGALVACMVMTRQLPVHIFDVPRHAGAEAKIVAAVKEFWVSVEEGLQPVAADGRDAQTLAAMFPRDNGEVVDLGTDNYLGEMLAERATLKADIGDGEKRLAEIDAEIKAKMGEASEGRLPGWRISWRSQTRKEAIIPASTFRVLRITDLRSKEEIPA